MIENTCSTSPLIGGIYRYLLPVLFYGGQFEGTYLPIYLVGRYGTYLLLCGENSEMNDDPSTLLQVEYATDASNFLQYQVRSLPYCTNGGTLNNLLPLFMQWKEIVLKSDFFSLTEVVLGTGEPTNSSAASDLQTICEGPQSLEEDTQIIQATVPGILMLLIIVPICRYDFLGSFLPGKLFLDLEYGGGD